MRWSTKKFAEDILWACKEARVDLSIALGALPYKYRPYRCPIIIISALGEEISCLFDGPYCNEMAILWDHQNISEENIKLCRSRIKAVKQWFKENGYLEDKK